MKDVRNIVCFLQWIVSFSDGFGWNGTDHRDRKILVTHRQGRTCMRPMFTSLCSSRTNGFSNSGRHGSPKSVEYNAYCFGRL